MRKVKCCTWVLLIAVSGIFTFWETPVVRADTAAERVLDTGVMGGISPTVDDLAAMTKGQYILHARDGKLSKVAAERSFVPDSPPGDMVEIRMAIAPDGTVYFNGNTAICKSTDGGRSWTSSPRGTGPAGEEISGTFQILGDGTFVCVRKEPGSERSDSVPIWASTDEGRTWQILSEIEVPEEDFKRYTIFGLFRLPDDTLLCVIDARNAVDDRESNPWKLISGKDTLVLYRSTDKGRSWEGPRPVADWYHEGGIVQLPSGKLLAVLRHRRYLLPGDPPNLMEKTGAKSAPFPYKHIFLANSDDGGRSWKNFRQLTTVFGQCYGYPAALSDGTVVVVHDCRYGPYPPSARVMISNDEGATWEDEAYYLSRTKGMQSVVLEDDTVLTIVETGGRLVAIRWKPVKE